MKTSFLLIVVSLLAILEINAQDFQGVATYQTDRKIDIKLDSSKMDDDMHNKMMAMMRKQFQKEFTLQFNQFESTYKEEEQLESPGGSGAGWNMQVRVVGSGGGSDIMYKNTKQKEYINKTELMGKFFLVQDALKTQAWELQNETKKIGQYTCYKATLSEEVDERSMSNENGEIKETTKKVERITTAWYTPEIPVNNGPDNFWGLPGLILEINDGQQSMLCSKIVLNPADKIEIIAPSKGKKVTQEEFDVIQEKKSREMMKNMKNNRSREGHNIQIRIGG
jgi:GLPGLI family protein